MTDRLVRYAKENRRNSTEPEIHLWRHLSNRLLGGFNFRRQHRVDGSILDFFCSAIALGIEVDGDTHDPEEGRLRDAYLHHRHGITIIRFTNADVMTNMEGVLLAILDTARTLPPRWSPSGVPHPNPSPDGEGL